MPRFRTLVSKLLALVGVRHRDRDLSDEIQAHLDSLMEAHMHRGLSADEARAAARREFGGLEQMKEAYREQRGLAFIDSIGQDIRYGLRQLRRAPGFTVAIILSLALGIGANTAIFTMINAILLKRLPVHAPGELRLFQATNGASTDEEFSYPLYQDFSARTDIVSGIAASAGRPRLRMTVNQPNGRATTSELVVVERVSGNFFDVLGVAPVLGRGLSADDDRPGDVRPVAVISSRLWSERFSRSPDVLSQPITIAGIPVTIVGVAPPGFSGIDVGSHPDVWVPLTLGADAGESSNRERPWLLLTARLRPGVSTAQARAAMNTLYQADLSERVRHTTGPLNSMQRERFSRNSLQLIPAAAGWTYLRKEFLQPLYVLMLLTAFVLLIAIANVANLLLARAAARGGEIRMRLALGAARKRLVRQLITESLIVAGAGGALGYALSRLGVRVLLAYAPSLTTRVSPDARILGFTLATSITAGLLFGLAPAMAATRTRLAGTLAHIPSARTFGHSLPLSHVLMTAQIAMSVFLLIGAGLFVRSLQNLNTVDLGFDRAHVAVFTLDVPPAYTTTQRVNLYGRILQRFESIPGVQSASYSVGGLLSGNNWTWRLNVPGFTPSSDMNMNVLQTIVGPRFFDTMGMKVVHGRGFGPDDDRPQVRTAVINETMARRFFTGNPIGRQFSRGTQAPLEIVGVVADSKYRDQREDASPIYYLPASQVTDVIQVGVQFEIRTRDSETAVVGLLPRAVREVDQGLIVIDQKTMTDLTGQSISQDRLLANLAGIFGGLALVLASIGVYGVRSYGVSRRTTEIGVRMALGANRQHIFWDTLRGTVGLVVVGGAMGVVLALAASRVVRTLLFGLEPTDPVTIVAAVAGMSLIAVIASSIPAYRAAAVHPMVALRHE